MANLEITGGVMLVCDVRLFPGKDSYFLTFAKRMCVAVDVVERSVFFRGRGDMAALLGARRPLMFAGCSPVCVSGACS